MKRILLALPVFLTACSPPTDLVQLTAASGQQSIVRDGVPSLISEKRHVVMLRPVAHVQGSNSRPRFVIAALNRSKQPVTMTTSDIIASRSAGAKRVAIRVYRYDELVKEAEDEKNAKLTLALLSGVAGAMSATNAGYTQTSGSVHGNNGYYGSYNATTYNPALAQMAANQNADRTADNVAGIQASGDAQLSMLQGTILKDHTLMPGEWHGGVIVLDVPEKDSANKAEYSIYVRVDGEDHEFKVTQARSS